MRFSNTIWLMLARKLMSREVKFKVVYLFNRIPYLAGGGGDEQVGVTGSCKNYTSII